MDKGFIEELKGLSREERKQAFMEKKSELLDLEALSAVNGGAAAGSGENPDSDVPYTGNWISSWGFVCHGEVLC